MKLARKSTVLFAIILLGLLGGALRIYQLDRESLWLDEGASIKIARMNLVPALKQSAVESYVPAYNALLHFWIKIFGDSSESVRMLSVIFGTLAIFAIFGVGREWFGPETGLLASLLLAGSTFNIKYSQETRSYTLAVFLTLLSYYFLRRLRTREKESAEVSGRGKLLPCAYLAINILLIFSHPFGVFIILAQNLYFFSLKILALKQMSWPVKKWLLVQSPLFVVILAWIIIMAGTSQTNQGVFWIPRPEPISLYLTLWHQAGSLQLLRLFGLLAILSLLTIGSRAGTPEAGPGLWNKFPLRFQIKNPESVFAILLWLIVPILTPFVFSRHFTPIFHIRYTILASPALYLITAQGICNLKYRFLKWPVAALVLALSLLSARGYFSTIYKTQWREAVSFLEKNAHPGDLVIFHQGYTLPNIYDYYSKRSDLVKAPFPNLEGEVNSENISQLDQLIQGHDRVWVIISHSLGDEVLLLQKLDRSCSQIYQKTFFGIEVYLCHK